MQELCCKRVIGEVKIDYLRHNSSNCELVFYFASSSPFYLSLYFSWYSFVLVVFFLLLVSRSLSFLGGTGL